MMQLNQLLSLVGAYYSFRIATRLLGLSLQGFQSFVLPSLWPRNFVKEYGSWAVITGCTRGIINSPYIIQTFFAPLLIRDWSLLR